MLIDQYFHRIQNYIQLLISQVGTVLARFVHIIQSLHFYYKFFSNFSRLQASNSMTF
ncbi:hypothetical protein J2T19_000378 [Paenibacillus tundrae]|uniref:Uncharacterized protein n=1 Tax=Paenibacillus tundrae TaxID=528187 RepID=A0ABT9W6R8_9BACL|nr:hypothetical protein [Paenibacillus tundrae]